MQPHATSSPSPASTRTLAPNNGILVLSGYGLRVSVDRRHLVVTDGVGRDRGEGRLAKATAVLSRLVVLGHTGYVTFDAMRWLHDVGAAFVHLDADGEVVTVSAPLGLDEPRLRRGQALAPYNGVGMEVARDLSRQKLSGQARVLASTGSAGQDAERAVAEAIEALPTVETVERLRLVEARGAAAYWSALGSTPLTFARKDVPRVPEHWLSFGGRRAMIRKGAKSAPNPANALLNYLYAILEAEARIACLGMGLDPGLGVLHADATARDSLALDVMEAVRPDVDAYVLELVSRRVMAAREFFETRTGVCRLMPPWPKLLAETAPRWRRLLGPVVEEVADRLAAGAAPPGGIPKGSAKVSLARKLTSDAKRLAVGAPRSGERHDLSTLGVAPAACRECGVILPTRTRDYCEECLPAVAERARDTSMEVAHAKLAELRAVARNPAQRPAAQARRAARGVENTREVARWEREHAGEVFDPETFRREILPGLQTVSVSAIMRATGLSVSYCSDVRKGSRVPHPRHWAVLTSLRAPGLSGLSGQTSGRHDDSGT